LSGSVQFVDAFRQGLRELGWIEGQNIILHYLFAEGRFDRLPDLAADLIRLEVEIIVAAPTPAAVAAKNATTSVPIVMTNVGDPVGLGVIASLARPGGNVIGLAYSVGLELFGKQLEVLREAIPELRRAAILSNPTNPAHALALSNVKVAAQNLGVELQLLETRGPDQFEEAFSAMAKNRAEALLAIADTVFVQNRTWLAQLSAQSRLPSMHGIRENVEAGGFIYYGHNSREQFRQAAGFVDKILKGAKPADLPVQQPTKFELVINLKTAKALGLTIPPTLFARADEVIE
jgi:putative ABC transport system substrate-binding protein